MSLLSSLRSTCDIERQTSVKDTSGGDSFEWQTLTADVACDIQPASGNVVEQYAQKRLLVTHSIFFAADVGIRETDRLKVGSRIFSVQGYAPPADGYPEWPARADVLEDL